MSKILDLVENASSRKSRSEDFISRFARIYTPAVCYSALALALLPPLVRMLGLGLAPDWGVWLYRALTFLVISCPCALVISIPLSFFAGIGGASQVGILIKGSNYLETLSQTKTVVFDKTGTLTQGVFEVSGIHHAALAEEKLLEYAALAESSSSHPISKSLQRAWGKEIDRSRVTDIQEQSGCGVTARVDGTAVAAGNDKLMRRLGVDCPKCHQAGTIVHLAVDGAYAGHIVVSDVVKPGSRQAISALRSAGVDKTVMLTGDARAVAEQVASDLGIDQVFSELLPADKVAQVEKLLEARSGKGKLAFVGDGINDAPVLSRADIGIAMGAMGSDAAIEAADIVPEVPGHCLPEHRHGPGGEVRLPDPGGGGHRQYVSGYLCRRGRYGSGSAQRHPVPVCGQGLKKCTSVLQTCIFLGKSGGPERRAVQGAAPAASWEGFISVPENPLQSGGPHPGGRCAAGGCSDAHTPRRCRRG